MTKLPIYTLPFLLTACLQTHKAIDSYAPDINILSPEDASSHSSLETVTFCAHVFDEDSIVQLDVTLQSDVDGDVTPNWSLCPGGNFGGEISLTSTGSHVLTLAATDLAGNATSTNISINLSEDIALKNNEPTCTILTPAADATFSTEGSIELSANANDTEDAAESLSVSLNSDIDGLLWSGTPDTQGLVSHSLASPSVGTHTLTLTVTDSSLASGSCTVAVSITD